MKILPTCCVLGLLGTALAHPATAFAENTHGKDPVVSITDTAPQPAPGIRERARGYGRKTLSQVSLINEADGINAKEAMLMAEWMILGSVDVTQRPVQHYSQPRRENANAVADSTGDWWVVDVFVTQQDASLANQPIRIDAITSEMSGKDWYNTAAKVSLTGDSWFHLRRQKDGSIRLQINLEHHSPEHDAQTRADCLRDALAAAEIVNRNFGERFEAITEADFALYQRKWHDIQPLPVWQSFATATLREKQPVP